MRAPFLARTLALVLPTLLAGCGHYARYAPEPTRLEVLPQRLDAARLPARTQAWDGAGLLREALARNAQVREAQAKHAAALAAVRVARLAPPLTLTLTAEYANEKPTWGYGAAGDASLDVGGRRSARVTIAQLQALQAWYDVGEAAWAVRGELAKARVDRRSADAETALTERLVALRRERLQRLERRVAAGEDERGLTIVAQTDLATAERRLAAARGRRGQADAALAKALGIGASAAAGLSLASTTEPGPLDRLATWRRDAALHRSDVLRALVDYDLAEQALRQEVAKQYPQVTLSPGYNYDHGVTKLPFSLSLALPTADLNRRAIGQAEKARAAAGAGLERVQANTLAAVDVAAAALDAAQADAERLRTRELPAARQGAQAAARSVRAGEADRVDDLAAQAAEVESELNLLDARRAALTALADLEDALRRPFDPGEADVLQAFLVEPGARP